MTLRPDDEKLHRAAFGLRTQALKLYAQAREHYAADKPDKGAWFADAAKAAHEVAMWLETLAPLDPVAAEKAAHMQSALEQFAKDPSGTEEEQRARILALLAKPNRE